MKKITRIVIVIFAVTILISTTSAYADVVQPIKEMQMGDYFILGKYNDEPIVWRYVADDQNGKLIVSDKILCFKPFGKNNFWEESYIRRWLNSTKSEGEEIWNLESYKDGCIDENLNLKEKGFLHKSNFSLLEKNLFKTVTQLTMLPQEHIELSTNGETEQYNAFKKYKPGRPEAGGYFEFYDISELSNIYIGAAYELTDTIFLMDELQIYNILNNFSNVKSLRAKSCESQLYYFSSEYYSYFLRTPQSSSCSEISNEGKYQGSNSFFANGIRPAFYLDEDNAVILSGSGTAEEPYIMTGREIEVYTNGTKAEMGDQATIKDGIVMLPVKETFKKLGAKVNWDEETQSVTIEKDGNYIYMLRDNKGIMINGEIYDLGYPMTMIEDVAYIPLTAIEMSITPNVTWNGEQYRIDINTK